MLYKTITLELLQQYPQLHDQLRKNRKLLATVGLYAKELKTSHEAWKELLLQARPGSEASQIRSEALEIALKEIEDSLDAVSVPNPHDPISLDAAMAFLRRRMPPA